MARPTRHIPRAVRLTTILARSNAQSAHPSNRRVKKGAYTRQKLTCTLHTGHLLGEGSFRVFLIRRPSHLD
jgi:hypothetical protein